MRQYVKLCVTLRKNGVDNAHEEKKYGPEFEAKVGLTVLRNEETQMSWPGGLVFTQTI